MNNYSNIISRLTGNTGMADYAQEIGQIKGILVMPRTKSYDLSTYVDDAAFLTALKADVLNNDKFSRVYPILNIIDMTDGTGDNAVQTSGYGIHQKTTHSFPKKTFTLPEGGMRVLQNLYQFEKTANLSFAFWDENNTLWFKRGSDGKAYGWKGDLTIMYKNAEGTNAAPKTFTVDLAERDVFINKSKVTNWMFDVDTSDLDMNLSGCHDITLELVSASASAIVVKAYQPENHKSMGLLYENAMEQVGAWSLILGSTGAPVTITTVSYSATAETFTLAGTFTLAKHILSNTGPATLAALATPLGDGATGGFESNIISVTPTA